MAEASPGSAINDCSDIMIQIGGNLTPGKIATNLHPKSCTSCLGVLGVGEESSINNEHHGQACEWYI